MKIYVDCSVRGTVDVRDSKYYESLIADGKSLIGEGLFTSVLCHTLNMDYNQLLKMLRYSEHLDAVKRFDNGGDK